MRIISDLVSHIYYIKVVFDTKALTFIIIITDLVTGSSHSLLNINTRRLWLKLSFSKAIHVSEVFFEFELRRFEM